MQDEIKQLLLNGEFLKAFGLIISELNKSYDLSDSRQREYLQCLSKWKELCNNSFTYYLNNGKFLEAKEDTSTGEISLFVTRTFNNIRGGIIPIPKPIFNMVSNDEIQGSAVTTATLKFEGGGAVAGAVVAGASIAGACVLDNSSGHLICSKIKTKVISSDYRNGMDAYLIIVSSDNSPSFNTRSPQKNKISIPKLNLIKKEKLQFTIPVNENLKEFDLLNFKETIAKSINEIKLQNRIDKIGVVAEINSCSYTWDELRVLFLIILACILTESESLIDNAKVPQMTFLSEDPNQIEIVKVLLEELTGKNKIGTNKIPGMRMLSKKLSAQVLIEKSLTKDAEYKSRLEALAKIIDEPDVPILILGESGVGKSFLAENIHQTSFRDKKPLVTVNCGGMSANTQYQWLWGWNKGSFTGATESGEGAVQRAENGTLFLDEIDRAPKEVRDSILTFIENKKYVRLGDKEKTADVRLIFGSNKDLKELVRKGEMEEDFLNRINQRIIEIPPLRNRINDIDVIVSYATGKFYSRKGTSPVFRTEAIEYLKTFPWQDNVRGLIQYVNNRLLDAWADEEDTIAAENLRSVPPESKRRSDVDDLQTLENILKKLLDNWDSSNGPFLQEIVSPLLSKLFIEDCFKTLKKTQKNLEAMEILGISGERGKDSKLQEYYAKYQDIKSKLGLK